MKNYRVYQLFKGMSPELSGRGTQLAHDPAAAAKAAATTPGEYVVTDLDFTEIHKVAVHFQAETI